MGKTICIRFGEEFKAINYAGKNDVFKKQYEIAKMYLNEIAYANIKLNEAKEFENCVNNIIAFTGERGQGKTSAMMSFVNSINIDDRFSQLDIIDPSTFENMHNVVEVIVTKMYNKIFENKLRDVLNKEDLYRVSDSFQKVYESLSLVRNPNKFDELEQDYEGTIQKIIRAGDSAQLKRHMFTLVEKYLDIAGYIEPNKKRPSFLIIQIDDIDLNISLVYKMTEQIRKYLMIPNIIIIMGVKIEQLKLCIELQFRKEMHELDSRINKQEPITMAAKYVEKLIPDGRKITLPELRLLAGDVKEDSEEITNIEYLKDNEDLLLGYQGYGLESTILGYIYEKTGLHFVKKIDRVHPIVPNTLRELVNLISVLGKLNPYDKKNNLDSFEQYFLNTWVPNNLDEGYVILLRRIHNTNHLSINKIVCSILLDKLDNSEIFTLDTELINSKHVKFNEIKNYIKGKKSDGVSLGDTQELIRFFEDYYTDQEPKLFAFALQTIYSIIMNKLLINAPWSLYDFINGSIWGHDIILKNSLYQYSSTPKVRDCIQAEGTSRLSRTYFEYNSQYVISSVSQIENKNYKYLSNSSLNDIDKNTLIDILFFSDFNPVFIRRNWSFDDKPMFNLENLFISSIYPNCIQKKVGDVVPKFMMNTDRTTYYDYLNQDTITKIATNIELSTLILEYISKDVSQLHDKEEKESDHFERLLNNIDAALSKESEERVGETWSIFRNTGGKNQLINTYMCFWKMRTSVNAITNTTSKNLENISFITWLKENKLNRVCKLSTFGNRYKVIIDFLSENVEGLDTSKFAKIIENLNVSLSKDKELNDTISRPTRQIYNTLCDELTNELIASMDNGV